MSTREPKCLVSSLEPGIPAIYVHSTSPRDGRYAITVDDGGTVHVTLRLTPAAMRELARLIGEVLT